MGLRYKYLISFLLFSAFLQAQQPWSLQKCVEYAITHNTIIAQSEINQLSAGINHKTAMQSRLPNLNMNVNGGFNSGRFINPATNDFESANVGFNSYSLGGGLLVFGSGVIKNSIEQANINLKSTEMNTLAAKQNIMLNVASSYIGILYAMENLAAANNQSKILNEQKSQTSKLINAGLRPSGDILEIEARIADAERNIISAENALDLNYLIMKNLLKLNPGETFSIETPEISIEELLLSVDYSFEEVYAFAVQTRPEIQAAEFNIKSAQLGEKVAKSNLYPRLTAGYSLSSNYSTAGQRINRYEEDIISNTVIFQGNEAELGFKQNIPIFEDNPYFNQLNENFGFGVSAGLSVPIYNNYTNSSRFQLAELQTRTAELRKQETLDQLANAIQQAIADNSAARKEYEAAMKSYEANAKSLENIEKKFNAGSASSFELSTANNNVLSAEISRIIAKYRLIFTKKVVDFYMGEEIEL